jgi:catechol 2,3-dioxygenase-like lactoylglutathione lyase family enzyme
MKIEHAAYQIQDPVAVADWYVKHLGMSIKRAQPDRPFGQFLADGAGTVMLEFYNHPKVEVPDYRRIDPLILHVAFSVDDVAEARQRLLSAGATPEGEVTVTDAGDHLAMLRDPWGFPVQLVHRRSPMISS